MSTWGRDRHGPAVRYRPAVDGSRVYVGVSAVGDPSRAVYAFDPATGTQLWRSPRVAGQQFDAMSEVSVAGGVAYLNAQDHLRAYDAATGKLRWTSPAQGNRVNPVIVDGRLIVGTAAFSL
jgi:outer membrane protein assembly factor BamB